VSAAGVAQLRSTTLKDDTVLIDRDEPEVLGPPTVRAVDVASALVTAVLIAAVALGVEGPVRIVPALLFVTFVPGWAALGHSRLGDGIAKIALAVAASLTLCAVTALAMAWLGSWHPLALFYALAGGSLVLVLSPSRRRTLATVDDVAVAEPPVAQQPGPEQPVPEQPVAEAPVAELVIQPVIQVPSTPVVPSRPAQPKRHIVRQESLRLTRVDVRVAFPTRSPFAADELADFFAAVNGRHPFVTFTEDADTGAVMETSGSRRLEIGRDGVDYSEGLPTDLEMVKTNAVDLLGEVQQRLGVQILTNPSCRLQALWRSDSVFDGDSPSLLFARTADVGARHLGLLGNTGAMGVGLRFSGQSDEPRRNWQVMMEPEGRASLAALDVVTESGLAAASPEAVGEHLEQAHRFLTESVVRFVATLVEPPSGEPDSDEH